MNITFVIPTKRTPARLLARCLDSINAVRMPGDEVICVDGHLQSEARNIGIEKASREWIWFVDADDIVTCRPSFDTGLVAGSDVLLFGLRTQWGGWGRRWDSVPPVLAGRLDAHMIAELNRSLLLRYPVNKLYRRTFLCENSIRFEVGSEPCEDALFNLSCVLRDARFSSVSIVPYVYMKRWGSSLSRYAQNLRKSLERENALWDEIIAKFSNATDATAAASTTSELNACKWTQENIQTRCLENELMHGGDWRRSSVSAILRRAMTVIRRALRFCGI